jgi:hypothetical protein
MTTDMATATQSHMATVIPRMATATDTGRTGIGDIGAIGISDTGAIATGHTIGKAEICGKSDEEKAPAASWGFSFHEV